MRNNCKYTKLYSGGEPEFIEGDVFEIHIPLTTGAMTKVGASGQIGTQTVNASSGKADRSSSGQAEWSSSGQAEGKTITVNLDIKKLNELLDFCEESRTRNELQEFCGIKSRDYFRT